MLLSAAMSSVDSSKGPRVLLTGVSGFVARTFLDQLLKSDRNYHVTCVIRSKAKTEPCSRASLLTTLVVASM